MNILLNKYKIALNRNALSFVKLQDSMRNYFKGIRWTRIDIYISNGDK